MLCTSPAILYIRIYIAKGAKKVEKTYKEISGIGNDSSNDSRADSRMRKESDAGKRLREQREALVMAEEILDADCKGNVLM